jgi:hypothetical protein
MADTRNLVASGRALKRLSAYVKTERRSFLPAATIFSSGLPRCWDTAAIRRSGGRAYHFERSTPVALRTHTPSLTRSLFWHACLAKTLNDALALS